MVDKKAEADEMDKTDGVDVTSKVENVVDDFVDQIRHSVTAKENQTHFKCFIRTKIRLRFWNGLLLG